MCNRPDGVKCPFFGVVVCGKALEGLLVVDGVQLPGLVGIEDSLSLHQFMQCFHLASPRDKFVPQQLLSGWSLLGLFDQTPRNEVLEVFAEVALQPWRRVLWNMEEDFHGVDVGKRWLAIGHFHCCDGQGPDVGLEVVASLLDDLRRHPERSADEGVTLGFYVGELGGNTEICELDLARLGQQHIGCLDVTMDLALGVEVFQPQQQLPADDGNESL